MAALVVETEGTGLGLADRPAAVRTAVATAAGARAVAARAAAARAVRAAVEGPWAAQAAAAAAGSNRQYRGTSCRMR